MSMDVDITPRARKVLVFVNPFSGPGKALDIYQKRVVPTLAELDLNFHLIITERAGHAKDVVKTIDISEWYGVIIVSGDGLIFEVINGLMSRPDWEHAIHHLPLGVVPGGSGNALCCAINSHNGEPYKDNILTHSLFVLAKHKIKALDLVAVDTCEGRHYSFLSITWGIISDVDIESEKYRSLGNARFTVGALVRIVGLRTYHGRLSFLPCEPYRCHTSRSTSCSTWEPSVNANTADVVTSQPKSRSLSCPDGLGDSATEEVLRSRLQHGGPADEPLTPVFPEEGGGDLETVIANSSTPAADSTQLTCDSPSRGDAATPRPVETALLPPLSDPVPASWVTIEDNFVTVVAAYESHLGPDIIIAPEATFNDGIIHLMFAKAGISRSSLLKLFLSMENGSHVNSPDIEIIKVKAFRLEPITPGGVIAIDGEKVKYGPIQAQVLPGLARFMA
ncbi:sphingosine kinase 1 isoform X2 [Lingula anatina]|uniref:sphingosine kinase n=1 Tax=Lingula anatina TaxID=7574 RepID=A0A1S3IJL0_LINAN|nr:sphingosine kinase 1 isoform X2 [Lingula anatina]|eukprot:XP_013398402.1 sphingosine kinase 1 isoform X2 [Lingula anatina]